MKSNMACKLLWRFSNVCAQCPFHYPHVPLLCMCMCVFVCGALCIIHTRAIHCVQLRWQSSLSTAIGKWNELTPKQWNACVSHSLFIDHFFIIAFVFIIIHDANYLIIIIKLNYDESHVMMIIVVVGVSDSYVLFSYHTGDGYTLILKFISIILFSPRTHFTCTFFYQISDKIINYICELSYKSYRRTNGMNRF